MFIALILIFVLVILWLLSLRGRTGHPGLDGLRGWSYAHRGLHGETRPENSMAAFRAALEAGYGIELDVHLLKDGNLAVMHDSALQRTTGQPGKIEDLTTAQLSQYTLENSTETIPEFRQVLDLFRGKAPMIIELKSEGKNHAALCQTVCAMLDEYEGVFCLESFDPHCILWLRRHRPDLIRGQLSENFLVTNFNLPYPARFLMTANMVNFLTRPDFIAYKFADRRRIGVRLCRRLYRIQGVAWTLQTRQEYEEAVKDGWIPIFEDFKP